MIASVSGCLLSMLLAFLLLPDSEFPAPIASRARPAVWLVEQAPAVVPPEATPLKRKTNPHPIPHEESPVPQTDDHLESLAQILADDLEYDLEVARKIMRILALRDEEAERVLEPYQPTLTREVLQLTHPRLQTIEDHADREVLALLDPEGQKRYRDARSDGRIAGVTLWPLPESHGSEQDR